VSEGYEAAEVAEFLGVHPSSVRRWWRAYQKHGAAGLAAKPVPGRPPKLTAAQEAQVLSWLGENPTSFGFATELWTAKRLALLIKRRCGVKFHSNYLSAWLTQRNITPQKPEKRAIERKDHIIQRWRTQEWPRIQNARVA
jgi:transposase